MKHLNLVCTRTRTPTTHPIRIKHVHVVHTVDNHTELWWRCRCRRWHRMLMRRSPEERQQRGDEHLDDIEDNRVARYAAAVGRDNWHDCSDLDAELALLTGDVDLREEP